MHAARNVYGRNKSTHVNDKKNVRSAYGKNKSAHAINKKSVNKEIEINKKNSLEFS